MTPVVLMLFFAVALVAGPLFAMHRVAHDETRKRTEQVRLWQWVVDRRRAPHLVFVDDNVLTMTREGAGYRLVHEVCGYHGLSYELERSDLLTYEEALPLFTEWEQQLKNRTRYHSGLLYPPYHER